MANVVVDSSAWVEYAEGSEAGERARAYVEGEHALYTPSIVVAELADRSTRSDRRDAWIDTLYPYIRGHTTIVPLAPDLADRAGALKWEMRESNPQAGLADAIVLATAREHDARVLTGGPDFLVPALADEVIDVTDTDE